MPLTPTLTEYAAMVALRDALLVICATNTDVIRGDDNRVPAPTTTGNYVVMSSRQRLRLATNTETWEPVDADAIDLTTPTRWIIQVDSHGPQADMNAQAVMMAMRSAYGVRLLADTGFVPLHADDPQYLPFLNDAGQYEYRWVLAVHLQGNPTVSTPQEFADTVAANVVLADSGAA